MKDLKTIAITLAGLLLLVSAYFSYVTFFKTYRTFDSGSENANVEQSEACAKVQNCLEALKAPSSWESRSNEVYPLKTFDSIPLYQIKGEIVDLTQIDPIYEGVPNRWFVEHQLDITIPGILSLDTDQDGFENQLEFEGQTNPNDSSSFPDLMTKLVVNQVIEKEWLLEVGSEDGNGGYKFKYTGSEFEKTLRSRNYAQVGEYIFPGKLDKRFLLKSIGTKQVERFGSLVEQKVFRVEDQLNGEIFEIPRRIRSSQKAQYYRKDQSVQVYLDLPDLKSESATLNVGQSFALPFNAEDDRYQLTDITKNNDHYEMVFSSNGKNSLKKYHF